MKITFFGAAQTVTGSQHLIEVNGTRILLDCGLGQGKRAETYERNQRLPFDPASIDVMVLSHAHIDHSGNIPNLVKRGFRGDIFTTHATRDLCTAMLLDSAHIQESDIEFVNRRRARQKLPPVQPLYTDEDARRSLDSFIGLPYHRSKTIAPGVTLTLHDAGHMLGSAIVVLEIEDRAARRAVRLVFSGDLGRRGLPIIRDPEFIADGADILILESTYGDTVHPPYEDDARQMERIIADTYRRGGQVLIPAFAVGRTQQIVYALHQLMVKGDLPPMPVYVDSPLAIDVTAIFRMHPECYDSEISAFLNRQGIQDAFGFERLTYTRQVEQSKQLNFLTQPAIIIAASGMAEAGRILHHLKNRIEDPRTTILFVGWQAPDTLGRRILDGAPEVNIFGEPYHNRAQAVALSGFSGHADQPELLDWVGAMTRRPRHTFLVHGEPDAAEALRTALRDRLGIAAHYPEFRQSFEV
jgi:metallo-beta-lactamase family protein